MRLLNTLHAHDNRCRRSHSSSAAVRSCKEPLRGASPFEVGRGWPLLGLKRFTRGNIMSGSSACWFSLAASVSPLAPCAAAADACLFNSAQASNLQCQHQDMPKLTVKGHTGKGHDAVRIIGNGGFLWRNTSAEPSDTAYLGVGLAPGGLRGLNLGLGFVLGVFLALLSIHYSACTHTCDLKSRHANADFMHRGVAKTDCELPQADRAY